MIDFALPLNWDLKPIVWFDKDNEVWRFISVTESWEVKVIVSDLTTTAGALILKNIDEASSTTTYVGYANAENYNIKKYVVSWTVTTVTIAAGTDYATDWANRTWLTYS